MAVEATRRGRPRRAWWCSPTSRPASRCGCPSTSAYHWAPTEADRDLPGARRHARSTAPPGRLRQRIEARPAPPRGRVLAPQRHRGRGRAGHPARRALQPLPAHAGHRARRGPRRAGQGHDRARLRGPLLLGHGDLRGAVPGPHQPAVGEAGARVPPPAAGRGAQARPRGRPRRRAVPVAHDHRRGGLGVVRVRHRAVPHQRGHRVRDAPVQPRDRRPRLHARPGRRGARGDRALLDGARLLRRAPRRALLDHGRDRPGRVHDSRGQQRLHEPDGEGEPRDRHARDRVAPGRGPRGPRRRSWPRRASPSAEVDGWRRAADAMYVPRHEELGIVLQDERFLERKRWDFDAHARRRTTRCCSTTTRSRSTATR